MNPIERAYKVLRKPTTFVIVILICVILIITMQFGALQHEIDSLSKKLKGQENSEHRISNRLNSLSTELRHVEKDERELKSKELQLEKKEQLLEKLTN